VNETSPNRLPEAGRLVAGLFLWLLVTVPGWSQTVIPSIPSNGVITVEQIESAVAAVETQEGLDEETRGRVIDQLRDAQAQIQNRASAEMAAGKFAAVIETAPAETAQIHAQLDAEPLPPTDESLGLRPDMTLVELEQALARETATLTASESELSGLEAEIDTEDTRPSQARQRIEELQANRSQLKQQIETAAPAGESPVLTDARRLAVTLRRDAQEAEIRRLEQESLSHGVRLTLLNARRDLAERNVTEQRARVALLQEQVNSQRQAAAISAQQDAAITELASADSHPVVRQLAEGNAELTRELPAVAVNIERSTQQIAAVEEQARQLEQSLARSRQRLEIAGINRVIGRLFVEERRNLPTVSAYRAEVTEHRQALAEIGLAQVQIDEQRRELTPIDASVEAAMAEVTKEVSPEEELETIESEVRLLLQNRRDLLNQAASTYTSYLRALGDLDVAQRRLLNAADEYKQFLDQHLLWIPSTSVLGIDTLRDLLPAIAWALSPDSPLLAALAILVLGALWFAKPPLRRRFEQLNSRVGRLSTDNIRLTAGALIIVAIHALPLPLALAFLSLALMTSTIGTDFTLSVAESLLVLAPFMYNLTLYRLLCSHNGVARIHFAWPESALAEVRRQLGRFAVLGAPMIFVAVLAYSSSVPAHRHSLGRVAFIVVMLLLSNLAYRIMQSASTNDGDAATPEPDQVSGRLWNFWRSLAAGGPILLALIAVAGYLYTAMMLTGRLIDTFWLILSLVVLNLIVLRWLSLARRKIAWQLAIKEREARREEAHKEADAENETEAPVVESRPLDLDAVDQQTRRLLTAGLIFLGVLGTWGIWSEVLPALNILDKVSLWTQTAMIDGQEAVVPVTLADLSLAVLVIVVTYIASRNLPGLMEIAVLQRLTLEPGSRYTINTLLRYVVVTIGAFSVLSIVGWDWSRIQWLVAALSVGLGFGLQEIVGNFVSGLVILFERPVRVGDTVTVGQITGTVSKVRIRATTIRDWDRKEIIVPNKSFITELVVNWTLSDPITRIVIPVGISYGSDVKFAHKVMEDALRAQPLILDEPEPKAYFMGFGDSSLDFKLYVYSRELGDRFPIMHAVHEDILQALRDNDIEIPFPQRDLHLRSVEDEVKIAKDGSAEPGPSQE
jgi:potassium efflux system protein